MKMISREQHIKELKNKIDEYVANGGSIYDGKRKNTFYEQLYYVRNKLSKLDGEDYSNADIFKMCGYDFNPDFDYFKNLKDMLRPFADESGEISTKELRDNHYAIYAEIRKGAKRYNVQPFDMVALMTGYRLSTATIETDYVAHVKRELLKAYPNRMVNNIKRENPDLDSKIRNIQQYMHLSLEETLEFLGFENTNIESHKSNQKKLSKSEVLNELKQYAVDNDVKNICTNNQPLYNKVVRLAMREHKSISDWFRDNGFKYMNVETKPLKLIRVDAHKRYDDLLNLKEKIVESILVENELLDDCSDGQKVLKHMSEIERFTIEFEAFKRIESEMKIWEDENNFGDQKLENGNFQTL
ncbi:MAG: hypothetical protein ACI4L6_01375 [Candidatus Onthoplasma sp.]